MMKKWLFIWPLVFIAVNSVADTQQTGARFLNLGVGGRELAMGGASVAISNDVNASYWNPAGLTQLSKGQFGITHSEWLLGSRYDYFGLAIPTSHMSIGVNGMFFTQPQQDGRDDLGNKTGNFSTTDMAMGLAAAVPIGKRLSFGTNVRYIENKIETFDAKGVSVDVGTQMNLKNHGGTSLGLAIRNLGPRIGFIDQKDPLPLSAGIGVGHSFFTGFLVSCEYDFDIYDRFQHFVIGSEYKLVPGLMFRAGYLSNASSSLNQNYGKNFFSFAGFVGGLGLNFSQFQIDYAFTPFGDLGQVHRLSIASYFGPSKPEPLIVQSGQGLNTNAPTTRIIFEMPTGWQPSGRIYTVKEGDTLKSVAKTNYGHEELWLQILVANPLTIQNPDNLTPGQKIFIPQQK